MIVPMRRVFVAARVDDREELLAALGRAGVVHLEAADPDVVLVDESDRRACRLAGRAADALAAYTPRGDAPDLAPMDAARRVDHLLNRIEEAEEEIRGISHQLRDFGPWGEVRRADLEALAAAGHRPVLVAVRGEADPGGSCRAEVGRTGGKRLVAVIDPPEELPEACEEIPWPERDRAALRAEIAELEGRMEKARDELAALANLRDDIHREAARVRAACALEAARRSGLAADAVFALQGWVPAAREGEIAAILDAAGLAACVAARDPEKDETPPTLVVYPGWVRPIKGLFDMLGTVAGYREFDVSVPFLIALPLFAAMLIGDAGYGLLLTAIAFVARRRIVDSMGRPTANLTAVLGLATVAWGVLTNGFFGDDVLFGKDGALVPVEMNDDSRELLSRVSLWIAGIHLSLAWSWRALRLYPDQRFLAPAGWTLVVWGMLGVIFNLLLGDPFGWDTAWPYLLLVGVVLAVGFHDKSANPLKRFGLGLANLPLELLAKFSDEISYIRLMAVGLASSVLAHSFNEMAFGAPVVLMPVILVLGHALNFALCLIAVFAHGVRLNMLEFSNNLGMEWKGFAYDPFTSSRQEA